MAETPLFCEVILFFAFITSAELLIRERERRGYHFVHIVILVFAEPATEDDVGAFFRGKRAVTLVKRGIWDVYLTPSKPAARTKGITVKTLKDFEAQGNEVIFVKQPVALQGGDFETSNTEQAEYLLTLLNDFLGIK